MLSLLFLACVSSSDKPEPRVVKGEPGTGDDTGDTAPYVEGETGEQPSGPDTGEETGEPAETGGETGGEETGGEETGAEPAPTEVCYPGEDWAWDTCFPLVDWESSWGEDYAYPEPYGGNLQYSAPARYLDLAAIAPGEPVAPNFVLDEFVSAEKGRYGLFQTHVVEALQAIRDESGGPLTVNSGYRNVTYNAGVGGAEYSRHQYGDAADLASSVYDLEELASACEDAGADYTQLYDTHVHCDWRDDPLDPAFYDVSSARPEAPPSSARPTLSARLLSHDGRWTAPALGFDEGEPLRLWTAYDAHGKALGRGRGERFVAPAGTARVEVQVGGQLRLEARAARGDTPG